MGRLIGDRLIAEAKVSGYLLNETHPGGASKASFFRRFGFGADRSDELASALLLHPVTNEITCTADTGFGIKTVVTCRMMTPDGRAPCIRSIWILDRGSAIQRFVTAYPMKVATDERG